MLASLTHGQDFTDPREELDAELDAPLKTEAASPDAELRAALGV